MKNSTQKADIFSNLLQVFAGSREEFRLEQRIFNAATLFIFFSGIITLAFNIANDFSLQGNITVGALVFTFLILYWFSRFKKQYSGLVFFFLTLIGVSFLWFFNDGLNGSTPALFIMCSMLFIGVTTRRYHFLVLIITVSVFILLLIIEAHYHKDVLIEYPNEEMRRSDLIFAVTLCIFFAALFISRLKLNYIKENKMIKEQRKELSELNSVKNRLFSIIGHDLTNQFNSILGFSEILKNTNSDTELVKIKKYADQLHETSRNTYSILNELLDWAGLQDGSIKFNPGEVNLDLIIQDLIRAHAVTAKTKDIKIETNVKETHNVIADYNMLKTIIRNLLTNALKFTKPGGSIALQVEQHDEKTLDISVEDTGIGMEKKVVDHLFDIEVNTRRTGTDEEPGTGLGLILCQGFLEKHGSELHVISEKGKGSIFSFTLQVSN